MVATKGLCSRPVEPTRIASGRAVECPVSYHQQCGPDRLRLKGYDIQQRADNAGARVELSAHFLVDGSNQRGEIGQRRQAVVRLQTELIHLHTEGFEHRQRMKQVFAEFEATVFLSPAIIAAAIFQLPDTLTLRHQHFNLAQQHYSASNLFFGKTKAPF